MPYHEQAKNAANELRILEAKIDPLIGANDARRIVVYNQREKQEECFDTSGAMEWLETIGLHAAYEMYAPIDVMRLMNFAR